MSVNDNAVGMLSDPADITPLSLSKLSRSAEAVDMTASLVSRPHAPLPTRHDTSSRIIAATCQGIVSCVPGSRHKRVILNRESWTDDSVGDHAQGEDGS